MIKEEKQKLRMSLIEKRKCISEKEKKDCAILARFIDSDLYNSCKTLLVYVSFGFEIETLSLIERALSDGKKVAVPLCNSADCTIRFFLISSLKQLKKGNYNILEPEEACCKELLETKAALCVVPGLSFDKNGFRIGFGKGYYDRFLSEFRGISVGFCYEELFVSDLLKDEYDKSVSFVITETKIYNTCQGE